MRTSNAKPFPEYETSHPLEWLLPLRLAEKIVLDETSGCWNWTAAKDADGYGITSVRRRTIRSHVLVFRTYHNRRIAVGLQLDHLCRNRTCCNPTHLEEVTVAVNVHRGDMVKANLARAAERTHFRCGHPISDENTILKNAMKSGRAIVRRRCRTCEEARKVLKNKIAAAEAEIESLKAQLQRERDDAARRVKEAVENNRCTAKLEES